MWVAYDSKPNLSAYIYGTYEPSFKKFQLILKYSEKEGGGGEDWENFF